MKATNAFAAKRALFDRLTLLAAAGGPLAGVQVAYQWPGKSAQRAVIYGGGVRFDQIEAAHDGNTALRRETAVVGLYVAVTGYGDEDGRKTDQTAEGYADAIGDLLANEPHLGGGLTYYQIASGQADYWPTDETSETRLGLQVSIVSYLA